MDEGFALKVYDPRDSSQRADDESTWKLTSNPALIGGHYASGMASALGLTTIAGHQFDWAKVARDADACEEMVPVGHESDDQRPLSAYSAETKSPLHMMMPGGRKG